MRSISASELDRAATYRLLSGLIVPRPIAWISSLSRDGVPNLGAFSFFTVVSADPPMIAVSINMTKARGLKDTYVNIHESGEFIVNFVDRATLEPMDVSAREYAPQVDEFEVAGLTPVFDARHVKAPRIAESPAQFECLHERTVPFGEYSLVVGKVVAFHLRDGLCSDTLRIDFERFDWVGRLTGAEYCESTTGFSVGTTHAQV